MIDIAEQCKVMAITHDKLRELLASEFSKGQVTCLFRRRRTGRGWMKEKQIKLVCKVLAITRDDLLGKPLGAKWAEPKTYTMNKKDLEEMLKEKYGDKLMSVDFSRSKARYMKETTGKSLGGYR